MCCAGTKDQERRDERRVISTLDEVRDLGRNPRLLRRRRDEVSIEVPELGREERLRLRSEIANYATACGCGQGRVAGMLTLLAYVVLLVTGVIPWRELGVRRVLLLYVAVSFGGMLIGKLYGRVRARLSLARLCRDLAGGSPRTLEGMSHGSSL
jgi:hypothetical protein